MSSPHEVLKNGYYMRIYAINGCGLTLQQLVEITEERTFLINVGKMKYSIGSYRLKKFPLIRSTLLTLKNPGCLSEASSWILVNKVDF